jgi:NodT family efflux transporter outer membrane factor (OMF) lipoprotein
VGPEYSRPAAPVSVDWQDAGDPRVKTGPAAYKDWWKVFADPALDRLVQQAYRDNLSLRIAGLRVLEARAQLGIAIGGLYPQTQQAVGSLQYNRTSERVPQAASSPGGGSASSSSLLSYWQSQVGLQASWEIDFWGKFRRTIESADASWQGTIADYDNALVSLTADVANAYVLIRTLEKRLSIARQNVAAQQESLQIAEARYQYGTASELDLELARTALYTTEASIPTLETQLRQTRNALSVLLGLPPGDLAEFLNGPSEIPASPPEVVVGIPADLLRRRPDVRSAEYQAAAQSAQIGVAKADLYPALSLTGTFGFLSSDAGSFRLSDMFRWSSRNAQVGPALQWNIFNYGRIENNVRLQDARFQELLITYQNTVLLAQRDVEDNLVAFLKAQDRTRLLGQSAVAARAALGLAVLQYRQGAVDFTTVLTAQQALLNAQDNLATSLGNISTGLVGVYRALGGGWEMREGKDLLPPAVTGQMARRTRWGSLLAPASYNPPPSEEPQSTIRPPDW